MAYHIYHTEALVLGGRNHGEGDRVLYCYTRELGLVAAHVKSLREQRSRLRYALQTFAHSEIDIIRGKHGWKLISARPIDPLSGIWREPRKRRIIAEHGHLIRRMIQGEERHEVLFDDVLSGIDLLRIIEDDIELHALELVFAVRLLSHLGYWGTDTGEESEARSPLTGDDPWSKESLQYASRMRAPLLARINRSLRETQL